MEKIWLEEKSHPTTRTWSWKTSCATASNRIGHTSTRQGLQQSTTNGCSEQRLKIYDRQKITDDFISGHLHTTVCCNLLSSPSPPDWFSRLSRTKPKTIWEYVSACQNRRGQGQIVLNIRMPILPGTRKGHGGTGYSIFGKLCIWEILNPSLSTLTCP